MHMYGHKQVLANSSPLLAEAIESDSDVLSTLSIKYPKIAGVDVAQDMVRCMYTGVLPFDIDGSNDVHGALRLALIAAKYQVSWVHDGCMNMVLRQFWEDFESQQKETIEYFYGWARWFTEDELTGLVFACKEPRFLYLQKAVVQEVIVRHGMRYISDTFFAMLLQCEYSLVEDILTRCDAREYENIEFVAREWCTKHNYTDPVLLDIVKMHYHCRKKQRTDNKKGKYMLYLDWGEIDLDDEDPYFMKILSEGEWYKLYFRTSDDGELEVKTEHDKLFVMAGGELIVSGQWKQVNSDHMRPDPNDGSSVVGVCL